MSRYYFIPLNWLITLIITLIGIIFQQYWLLVIWLIIDLIAGFEVFRQGRIQGTPLWFQNLAWSWSNVYVGIGNIILALLVFLLTRLVFNTTTYIDPAIGVYGICHLVGWTYNQLIFWIRYR
ncbi:hypothetical protein ACFL1A_00700 [Patescibacteria group bacterium]